jgi:uncharacterized protein
MAELSTVPHWRAAGLRYHAYNYYLRSRFGARVQKVSLDAGFTCPNVDGAVAVGGCVFCDNRSFSPSRRGPRTPLPDQLAEGMRRLRWRYRVDQFLAYFQPATNTYAPAERLRSVYEQVLDHPHVVGVAIGTRPDCVPDPVLDLLQELAGRTYVAVEYGMQTMHDASLRWMNRGHDHACMVDAVERSRGRGFEVCAHLILGLPGESHEDMLATAREAARLRVDAVKIHNLYVVRDTPLADDFAAGQVRLQTLDEFARTIVDVLEVLPTSCVIERVTGDAPPKYFVAPGWALDKPAVRRAIDAEFARRDSWQGRLHKATGSHG